MRHEKIACKRGCVSFVIFRENEPRPERQANQARVVSSLYSYTRQGLACDFRNVRSLRLPFFSTTPSEWLLYRRPFLRRVMIASRSEAISTPIIGIARKKAIYIDRWSNRVYIEGTMHLYSHYYREKKRSFAWESETMSGGDTECIRLIYSTV